jgi:hypothetical protein
MSEPHWPVSIEDDSLVDQNPELREGHYSGWRRARITSLTRAVQFRSPFGTRMS